MRSRQRRRGKRTKKRKRRKRTLKVEEWGKRMKWGSSPSWSPVDEPI